MPNSKLSKLMKRPKVRLVPRGEGVEVIRLGQTHFWFSDMYVKLLSMSWGPLLGLVAGLYFFSNLIFADFYYLNTDGIENAREGSFLDMYFFSVQTMATIGYGKMVPIGFISNTIVTIEALWGFTFFAFVTGLAFTKFARPTARVLFSDIAVISDYEGQPHLKIRMANQRTNRIVDLKVTLVLLRDEVTKEGHRMRKFYDLPMVRDSVPILQLTWTVMHPIDKDSPLYHITQESLREHEDEVIIAISGHDETLSQTIHARHSYVADEIVCSAFFEDVLNRREDGKIEVNYNLFHSSKPVEHAKKK
jgi:inward rectifier potassium channel